MASSLPPSPRDFPRTATEPRVAHRTQRLAFVLGIGAILAGVLLGWSAYSVSRRRLIEGFEKDTLNHARSSAELIASSPVPLAEESLLARLGDKFKAEKTWEESHLCVIDGDGRLLLHTGDPAKKGLFIGDRPIFEKEAKGSEPQTLLQLMAELRAEDGETGTHSPILGGVGMCTSLEGEKQLAACAYAGNANALVVIHVPSSSVDSEVNRLTLPWAIGVALTILFAGPLSLWGLSKAFADAERAGEQARVAERRAAEQVRILREIDRAILAGGSVEEIVRAALQRLGHLIPFQRASVVVFRTDAGIARVLAVQSRNPTEIGPGTEVTLESLRSAGFDHLCSADTNLIPDLDAAGELPPFLKQLRAEGVRSFVKLPLACRGDLFGALALGFDRAGNPAKEDLELAREVADVLSLAVLQARLRDELQEQAAELERRVKERTRELSEVNAELEGYVHSVSHDLRAPLRAVHGFGNLLLEETKEKLEVSEREFLQRIVSASERMNTLLSDLLDYSRLAREDIDVRPLDTQHVVEVAQDLLQVELQERRAVVDIVQPLLPVSGHHTSFVQAMTNLLSNAAKFVAPGVQPRIRVRTEPRGDRVRLWVEDNGIGIPPEKQEEIFRVFERLNGTETYPGTGMGLAIVRRAVQRMGGTTGVESKRGEGSRFWVELPRAETKA